MLAVVTAVGASRGRNLSTGWREGRGRCEPIVFELLATDEAYFLEHLCSAEGEWRRDQGGEGFL